MSSKENIQKSIQNGEYTILDKPKSNATWWNNFNRIKDTNDVIINYVQCSGGARNFNLGGLSPQL